MEIFYWIFFRLFCATAWIIGQLQHIIEWIYETHYFNQNHEHVEVPKVPFSRKSAPNRNRKSRSRPHRRPPDDKIIQQLVSREHEKRELMKSKSKIEISVPREKTDAHITAIEAELQHETDDSAAADNDHVTSGNKRGKCPRKPIIKNCMFKVSFDRKCYAVPLDDATETEEILIGTNSHRKTALDRDRVLVELIDDTSLLNLSDNHHAFGGGERQKYGKVIEIVKRAANMADRDIVCYPDPYTDNLMVPVDHTLPKMKILRPGRYESYPKRIDGGILTIPICHFQNRSTVIRYRVKVPNKETANKLFVVKWRTWNEPFHYPLGLVTEELPYNSTRETGLDILSRIYQVPSELDDSDVDITDTWRIPSEEFQHRQDCRAKHTITIDPEYSLDIDDALSVVKRTDGCYDVHIHIADVSYFIIPDHPIDIEARKRSTTYYRDPCGPVHMLPPRLSTNVCSLKQDKDRLALSLFIVMDDDGNVVQTTAPNIQCTIINCKARLTYSEAEAIVRGNIDGQNIDERTRQSVIKLHSLSSKLREKRLGNLQFASSFKDDAESSPHAHTLVEEMMLLANEQVARFLVNRFPNSVPLRRQLPPDATKLRQWYDMHDAQIANSVYLTAQKDYLAKLVEENLPIRDSSCRFDTIDIQRTVWNQLKSLNPDEVNSQAQTKIASIICSDENHPKLAPALLGLRHIMGKAEYVGSGESPNGNVSHTGLQMKVYTHFTSPIRRYIDIVVHRLLKAAITNKDSPYTPSAISEICEQCNVESAKSKEFQLKTCALSVALELKECPITVQSVIENIYGNKMAVGFPFHPRISLAHRKSDIVFSLLKPIGRPGLNEEKTSVSMRWKERVFHYLGTSHLCPKDLKSNRSRKALSLNTEQFIVKVSCVRWKAMQECVIKGDMHALCKLIAEEDARQSQTLSIEGSRGQNQQSPLVNEVTCELGLTEIEQKRHHYVEFNREFSTGDVIQVQLEAGLYRGLMCPKVAMINVTPTLEYCLEHRHDAVTCFAEIVDECPRRDNITTYQNTWLPVIEMMTSHLSVYGNENVFIHGVKVEWQQPTTEGLLPRGSFTLPVKFCNERHIRFLPPNGTGMRNDYLCIRSRHVNPQQQKGKTTIVAHAYVTDVDEETSANTALWTVTFAVNQCSSTRPDALLCNSGNGIPRCTIEVIPKPVTARRIERAVRVIHKSSKLIQDICLLKRPAEEEGEQQRQNNSVFGDNLQIIGSPFPPLNDSQQKAIRSALVQPFTVIQGPPGTGKTMTGACLVHFYTQMNSKLPNTGKGCPQVLYCGPSNKSVDVIAGYLKQFESHSQHKLSLLRVYGKSIEKKVFPPPGEPGPGRKMDTDNARADPGLVNISLHHKIRQNSNRFGEVIRAFESKFSRKSGGRRQPSEPSESDINEYMLNKQRAERDELKKHQVILCTCVESGDIRIRRHTNIVQCIVDEAGMCSEPETLIPLVATKPTRIVLIGDHKQLRPIIQETTAQQLGMEKSLLERYSNDMEMLDIQYRMHPAICAFPSRTFYEGKLKTAKTVLQLRGCTVPLRHKWPGGEGHPLVFCHIVGREETLSVHTEEGNEMSKANSQEVKQVVRIARTLVNRRYNVPPKKVVILTQYQLQRCKIEEALKECQLTDINVSTVIKSQGSEWDFVILSTVRSLPKVEIEANPTFGWTKRHLGFTRDEHLMNVALTRARKGLIIVGNRNLLQTDERWEKLLRSYESRRCIVSAQDFLPHPSKK